MKIFKARRKHRKDHIRLILDLLIDNPTPDEIEGYWLQKKGRSYIKLVLTYENKGKISVILNQDYIGPLRV